MMVVWFYVCVVNVCVSGRFKVEIVFIYMKIVLDFKIGVGGGVNVIVLEDDGIREGIMV